MREGYEKALNASAARLMSILREGAREGYYRKSKLDAAAAAILALIQGYFSLAASARDLIPPGSAAASAKRMRCRAAGGQMSAFELIALGVGDTFSELHHPTALLLQAEGFSLAIDCPDSYRAVLRDAALASGRDLSLSEVDDVLISTRPRQSHERS